VTSWFFRRVRPEQVREIVLLVLIVVLVAFFSTQIPNYFSGRTFSRISTTVPIILVVAVGQTLVVLTRNIDLSVGSIVGLVAYVMGTLLSRDNNLSPILVILFSVGIGIVLGAINGALVAYGRVPAIVATLGTLAIYRTVLVEFSSSQSVIAAALPDWVVNFNGISLFSVGDLDFRALVVLAIVVVIVFQLLLRYLMFGRRLFAIGSNPDAARVAGMPMQRDVFLAFVLCGALAGLGGLMYLVKFGNIEVTAAQGLELETVAAVVVGGVNLFGGSGSMVGVMLGAILLQVLDQSLLRWLAVSEFVRDALLGLLILLAVASDTLILNRLRAIWARQRRKEAERLREGPAAPTAPAAPTSPAPPPAEAARG
jgi:rhamnose transport system permease protein